MAAWQTIDVSKVLDADQFDNITLTKELKGSDTMLLLFFIFLEA